MEGITEHSGTTPCSTDREALTMVNELARRNQTRADAERRQELTEDGYDLPELADTMEEADARAAASTYLFALRGRRRDLAANDAEFKVLQNFNRTRHVARQDGLIAQANYLHDVIRKLFGFMTVTGKKKSLSLIGGRVGTRSKQDELIVEDDDAVLAWARAYGIDSVMRTTTTLAVDRKELRGFLAAYESNTDVPPPPGVKLETRPDEFFATPASD